MKIHNPKFLDYYDQQYDHKEVKDRRHLKCNPCELHVYKMDILQGTKKYISPKVKKYVCCPKKWSLGPSCVIMDVSHLLHLKVKI